MIILIYRHLGALSRDI